MTMEITIFQPPSFYPGPPPDQKQHLRRACAAQVLGILVAFHAWILYAFHVVVQAASNPQLL